MQAGSGNFINGGFIVLIVIFFGSLIGACSVGCGQELTNRYISPSQTKIVYQVRENCGATTPYKYKYYLSEYSIELNEVSLREATRNGNLFLVHVRGEVVLDWGSDSQITVKSKYLPDANRQLSTITKKDKVGDILIEYRGL